MTVPTKLKMSPPKVTSTNPITAIDTIAWNIV